MRDEIVRNNITACEPFMPRDVTPWFTAFSAYSRLKSDMGPAGSLGIRGSLYLFEQVSR